MAAYEAAGESNEWYTPPHVFEALGVGFDEDVAFNATWHVNGAPGRLVWGDFRRAARTLPLPPAPGAEA